MKGKRYTKREINEILNSKDNLQSWPWQYEEIRTAASWKRSLEALLVRTRASRFRKWFDSVVRAGSNSNNK